MASTSASVLFRDLRALNCLRVTGSFATNTQTEDSDIDFFVSGDIAANIERIKEVFRKHRIQVDHRAPNNLFVGCSGPITVPLEFSDFFAPKANRLEHVNIEGIEFDTY